MSDIRWYELSESQKKMVMAGRAYRGPGSNGLKSIKLFEPSPQQREDAQIKRLPPRGKNWRQRSKPDKPIPAKTWVTGQEAARRRELHQQTRAELAVSPVPAKPTFSTRYTEYMASEAWQELRRKIFLVRGYLCECCGTEEGPLNLHHKTYKRLTHELPEDLIILCRQCHEDYHQRKFDP